ncbi:hypothetical protein BXY82_1818 [Gelidibacter sediminis]|uniref:GAF domain-containing protein n=1 Tax=Gelidibacter sediminis TaxID=1608710 RepID=A0A4R7PXU1_9FLAO|nr:GAF domain-containing protein [Gelidibacter sediminis]TDU39787.1 hypothetical protein BXY82_1818 [Gelidibacter sediminis]
MENSHEVARIENLYQYEILDTPPDGCYDDMTSLASKIFDVPIAIISLVDTDRIWFKSSFGIDAEEIPRNPGLCSSAIISDDVYIVENARIDPRTLANPLVVGVLVLQFYAAAPLRSSCGFNLGTFCIIDQKPRVMSAKESLMLRQLSKITMDHFEVKLKARLMIRDLQKKSS